MLEDAWHDFQHQNQHAGGETASRGARRWSTATVPEPTCPADLPQRYARCLGLLPSHWAGVSVLLWTGPWAGQERAGHKGNWKQATFFMWSVWSSSVANEGRWGVAVDMVPVLAPSLRLLTASFP